MTSSSLAMAKLGGITASLACRNAATPAPVMSTTVIARSGFKSSPPVPQRAFIGGHEEKG